MEHASSIHAPASPTRCRTQCRWPKTAGENISFYGKHRQPPHQPYNSKKSMAHLTNKVLKVGRLQSAPLTSTATYFPNSISPTTSVPTAYCTTARHPVTHALRCWKDGDRLRRRSRRCLAAIRTKAWASTSVI